jgi:pimeloyl-ACP methyl ester carboxylesterase
MTRDDGIFDRLLPLLPNAAVVPWLAPESGEVIRSYARRLADSLAAKGPCFVGGVSFGGIVALEVARLIPARACFLISSIRSLDELPPWSRLWRNLSSMRAHRIDSLLAAVGRLSSTVPRQVRTPATARLTKFAGPAGAWHRWATSAVLRWTPSDVPGRAPIVQIHGDADATFPLRYTHPDYVIRRGGHVLPLTHPQELAAYMLDTMTRYA